jgi:anthraniloyl-CoA monooxygenase
MKIRIVGAGPAGLYFAILVKQHWPHADIAVYERHRADDTFGFGIVLSDETLANLRAFDPESHAEIKANFAYWDDIYTYFRGTEERSCGHGFSGIKRITLLQILQRRARKLGVELHYEAEADADGFKDADLVVAADGVNSATRALHQDWFSPEIRMASNRFVWLGANLSLPGFTYAFAETPQGFWNLHAYQYAPGECTLVVETTDATFKASGLGLEDEKATAELVERLFALQLKGAKVLTNRSFWRQFPTVHCKRWSHGNLVLLGDAAHSAHFSVGSGTKLALEDAISLFQQVTSSKAGMLDALAAYEAQRRNDVERIQHAAMVSSAWFEHVERVAGLSSLQFNYSLLSRSKQITHENLRLRDAPLIKRAERWFNQQVADQLGVQLPEGFNAPPMFAPLAVRDIVLTNRVVVSPMAQYRAVDGVPTTWHTVHYGARALGGAGLLFTEMTCVNDAARITPGCTRLWNDEQATAWRSIVDFVHQESAAKIAIQLGHAGRKGSTQLGWEQIDQPLASGNWPLLAPSALPYHTGLSQVPRVMTRADMDRVRDAFVASTKRAARIGFDWLELHMAHGYLLASFLSPITNRRSDAYGGTLSRRLAFPLEVFDAVRAVWPKHLPMSVRVSATDWIDGGQTPAETLEIARVLKAHGCDVIDVSSGQTDPASRPVYGRMYQAAFAEQIRLEAGLPVMAVGAITSADQVNTLLVSGRADLVALARPHLADPYFTLHAAADADYDGVSWPQPYLSGASQLYGLARRAKTDQQAKVAAGRPA